VRTGEGLERLLGDPHPLVALVARHALLRAESRGAHMRADFPATDPALDLQHSVSRAPDAPPVFERWT
jgi:succinate dehydrogenase/fumarate reductase flavoprotein subunit